MEKSQMEKSQIVKQLLVGLANDLSSLKNLTGSDLIKKFDKMDQDFVAKRALEEKMVIQKHNEKLWLLRNK